MLRDYYSEDDSETEPCWIVQFIRQTKGFSYFTEERQTVCLSLKASAFSLTSLASSKNAVSLSTVSSATISSSEPSVENYALSPLGEGRLECFDTKYELGKLLGAGGFGKVYQGKDKISSTMVVIKYAEKLNERIPNEVIVMKKLKHPKIVELLSFYMDVDKVKIVMKCHGSSSMSLYDYWVKLNYSISESMLTYFTTQIIKGVSYMHDRCIAHMDLKPENVIINKDFQIKIIDFGLAIPARDADFDDEPYYDSFGTTAYMSPELYFATGFYGPECDMWAIGCSIYHLLTRKFPCYSKRGKMILTADPYRPIKRRCSKELRDFFSCTFECVTSKRITARTALQHPWLQRPFSTKIFQPHYLTPFLK